MEPLWNTSLYFFLPGYLNAQYKTAMDGLHPKFHNNPELQTASRKQHLTPGTPTLTYQNLRFCRGPYKFHIRVYTKNLQKKVGFASLRYIKPQSPGSYRASTARVSGWSKNALFLRLWHCRGESSGARFRVWRFGFSSFGVSVLTA